MQRAFSGHIFFSFVVLDVKRRRCRDSKEGFVVTSGCSSCRIENTIFLLPNWFKYESSPYIFLFWLLNFYRVAAVCFVILTVKEACKGPTQVLRSEGRTKNTCCIVAYLRFIKFATLLLISNKKKEIYIHYRCTWNCLQWTGNGIRKVGN